MTELPGKEQCQFWQSVFTNASLLTVVLEGFFVAHPLF
jgi:hypothetical protein